ncbi:MAG: hypothetical protein SW127_09730 [Actinomycetota bacterium]|nr:hypothetical protein [Actinomycetota bacterium]
MTSSDSRGADAPDHALDAPEHALDDARRRVEWATRTARRARIDASDALRARARRRSAWFRVGAAIAGVVIIVVAGVLVGVIMHNHASAERSAAADAALAAADSSVAALLTADPADAVGYVDRAVAVTTGDQRDRIEAARDALMAEVTAQPEPSTGRVLSAGLITDPDSDAEGAEAAALVVAEASDPQLIGAQSDDTRLTIEVTMIRTGQDWLISRAVLT